MPTVRPYSREVAPRVIYVNIGDVHADLARLATAEDVNGLHVYATALADDLGYANRRLHHVLTGVRDLADVALRVSLEVPPEKGGGDSGEVPQPLLP